MKSKTLFMFLIGLSNICFAQLNKFEFDDGFCTYIGTYSTQKYTQTELQNTFNQLVNSTYIKTESTAWKIQDIPKLSVAELEAECNSRLAQLDTLDIVDTEFWENARRTRIREISETCELKALTIIAYTYPDTLLAFSLNDSLSSFYRAALIHGGDQLLEAWRVLNEARKRNNASPEKVQAKFDAQFNSPQKMAYAELEVMQFGWFNCANGLIYRDPPVDLWTEFEKLFIRIILKSECED